MVLSDEVNWCGRCAEAGEFYRARTAAAFIALAHFFYQDAEETLETSVTTMISTALELMKPSKWSESGVFRRPTPIDFRLAEKLPFGCPLVQQRFLCYSPAANGKRKLSSLILEPTFFGRTWSQNRWP